MYHRIRSVSRIDFTLDLRPRKLDVGRRNNVRPIEFPIGTRVPYDTEALYCYLLEQAERAFIPATAQAIAEVFEREFASDVPPRVIRATEEELQSNGIGSSSGNFTEPFLPSYADSSSSKAVIPDGVG